MFFCSIILLFFSCSKRARFSPFSHICCSASKGLDESKCVVMRLCNGLPDYVFKSNNKQQRKNEIQSDKLIKFTVNRPLIFFDKMILHKLHNSWQIFSNNLAVMFIIIYKIRLAIEALLSQFVAKFRWIWDFQAIISFNLCKSIFSKNFTLFLFFALNWIPRKSLL